MEAAETREERSKHTLQTLISEARSTQDALVDLLGSKQCLSELATGDRLPTLHEATLLAAYFGVSPALLMQVSQPSLGVSLRLGTVDGINDATEPVTHAARLLAADRLTRDWGFKEPVTPTSSFAPSKVWHQAMAGEKTAARLRAYLGIEDLDSIEDLTGLVESLGYPVEYRRLPNNIHGISVPEKWGTDTAWVILINSDDVWSRQRFTLSHELCHVLQKDAGHVIVDRVAMPDSGPERVANNFARHFLLPDDALLHKLSRHGKIDSPISAAKLIADLVLTYGISRDSLLISLREARAPITEGPYFEYCKHATVSEIMQLSGNGELWDELNEARGSVIPSERLTRQVLDAYAAGLVSLQSVADVITDGDAEAARHELSGAGWAVPDPAGAAHA
ncbi:ImmA/IrrE family metallo-endopeptidase [Streptomyces virginiae]|uniref:ImmA/IrrE family metallo-endopeptidase n=1 Tax=Streptomyces virginiae TaxID=1961 RepID=A0ABZ1TD93_STRVG|nr:ImmA/IrrE family metallo-endopeptidase [Streptomyces virginiae]